jgi:hypothetical protein
MKIDASTIKKVVELQYWYEHVPAPIPVPGKTTTATGFVYFKADEILPLLESLEKGLKE